MKRGQESWVTRVMRTMSCVSADAIEEQSPAQREEQEAGNRLYYKTETIYRQKDGVAASRKYKIVTLEMLAERLSNDTKTRFYACPLTKENVQELHALQHNNSMKYAQYAQYERVLEGGAAIDDAELSGLQVIAQRMNANGKEALYSERIEQLKSAKPEVAKAPHQYRVENKQKVHPVASVRL